MQKDPRVDYVSLPASVHFLVLCVARIEDHGVDHVLDSLEEAIGEDVGLFSQTSLHSFR